VAIGESVGSEMWQRASFWAATLGRLKRIAGKLRVQRKPKALQLEETLPLGERRFLAQVRWNQETLLVGVTPQSISLISARRCPSPHDRTCIREKGDTSEE